MLIFDKQATKFWNLYIYVFLLCKLPLLLAGSCGYLETGAHCTVEIFPDVVTP